MTAAHRLAGPLAVGLVALLSVVGSPLADTAAADDAAPAGALSLPGEQAELSSDPAAPVRVPAGIWRGEVGAYEADDGVRYFDYERVTDESTLLVSVVSTGSSPTSADALELEVLTPSGDTCTGGTASTFRSEGDTEPMGLEVAVGTQAAAGGGDESYPCLNENRLVVAVGRGSVGEEGVAPFALRVVEEAPLMPDAELPAATEVGEPQAPDVDSEREDLAGGADFEDAPEVSGGRYRASTTSDSSVLYRVPDVGWGQTVRAGLSVDPVDLGGAFSGPEVTLRVLTPMLTATGTSGGQYGSLSGDEAVQLIGSAGPVRYLNRRAELGTTTGTYAPGDHYVMVTVDPVDEGDEVDVPYTLEVEVAGEAEEAPAFTTDDPYLVAEGDEQPVVTAPGAGGFVPTLLTWLRYAGAALLAVVGVVAIVRGAAVLRARPRHG